MIPFQKQWKKIGSGVHHGINLPLSAIRSENSCGIGEFLDLRLLVDWCVQIGFDLIQLLPLNDSGDDPSPYFTVSSRALNPLFISLRALPGVKPCSELDELAAFNETDRVLFHEVRSRKLLFLRRYFEERGPEIIASRGFRIFLKEEPWVKSYALFKTLKSQRANTHWRSWPSEMQGELNERDIHFHCLLQFLAAEQLAEVKRYANSKNVLLMGDLPILISDDSCDVWERPEEFDLSLVAGAPPDYYNREGQVWGFPLFRWDVMQKNHYEWWKERLGFAGRFYDLLRIDHVLGFYRIWAVPPGHPSKEGHFIPKDRNLWLPQGDRLLKMVASYSPMLPIAEDLGTVFTGMREHLASIGLCGTKVMRWERFWDGDGSYIPIDSYNPLSLSTLSTHDSETVTLWWSNFPDEAEVYAAEKGWDYDPELTYDQRLTMIKESHQSGSLFHVNLLGEYLALFPELVWEDPAQERINIPGKLLPTNWTYRLRPSLEKLTSHLPLLNIMRKLY